MGLALGCRQSKCAKYANKRAPPSPEGRSRALQLLTGAENLLGANNPGPVETGFGGHIWGCGFALQKLGPDLQEEKQEDQADLQIEPDRAAIKALRVGMRWIKKWATNKDNETLIEMKPTARACCCSRCLVLNCSSWRPLTSKPSAKNLPSMR